jgi:hypothetical protein
VTGNVEQLPNGVVVHQATDEAAPKCNIYCEFPWCPADSHGFVYTRYRPELTPNPWEYVFCDLGTWAKRVLGAGSACSMADNRFYYRRENGAERREVVRVDLLNGRQDVLDVPPRALARGGLCISRDERYLAYSYAQSYRPQRFAIELADLHTGVCTVLHEDPWTCNTHLQFDRGLGRQLLVQHNRGCVFSPEGKCEVLCGKEGCTLFLLSVPDGRLTPLQVGPPYTASCSGHETWLGPTGEVLLTLNLQEDYDYGKGPICTVRVGEPARPICAPREMNHIGAPDSGSVFCADTYSPDEIILGSPSTGKAVAVCPARTSYRRGTPDTHPHAYLTPDLKWVVFNSDRTGTLQIYAAEIPPELIAGLR